MSGLSGRAAAALLHAAGVHTHCLRSFYASVGLFLGRVGRGHGRDIEMRGDHLSLDIRRRHRPVDCQGCPRRRRALRHFGCSGARSRTPARSPCRRSSRWHMDECRCAVLCSFIFCVFFLFFVQCLFPFLQSHRGAWTFTWLLQQALRAQGLHSFVFFVFAVPPLRADFRMGAAAHIAPPGSAFIRTSAAADMPPRVQLALLPVAAQRICINSVSKRGVTGANVQKLVTSTLSLHSRS